MFELPTDKWHQGWNQRTWTEHKATVWTCSLFFLLLGLFLGIALA